MREVREKEREGERKEDQELQRFVALCEKQSNKVASEALCKCAAGSLNVCEVSKHFTFIRKICSLIHLQYLCEELCFAIAFCEYEAYQGAASRCRISRFCLGKNISLFGRKKGCANVIALSAEKFHVLCKGARFRTWLIVPLRRTSGCSVTLLCAEDMLAYCDFVIAAPILITFMPDRRL